MTLHVAYTPDNVMICIADCRKVPYTSEQIAVKNRLTDALGNAFSDDFLEHLVANLQHGIKIRKGGTANERIIETSSGGKGDSGEA